jgi:hypothetical protein
VAIKDHGYTYIVMQGRQLGSMDYYIQDQCDLARADDAPLNATGQGRDGTWQTTDDVVHPQARRRYGLEPYEPAHPKVLQANNAVAHDTSADGTQDIGFRDITSVLTWASDYDLHSRVALRQDAATHRASKHSDPRRSADPAVRRHRLRTPRIPCARPPRSTRGGRVGEGASRGGHPRQQRPARPRRQ